MTTVSLLPDIGSAGQVQSGCQLINLALRLFLSGVTLTAGVGKLLDPAGGAQALADFGVPSRWVKQGGRILPAVEIGLSLALLVDVSSKIASLLLSALFLAFAIGIANLLRKDRSPPCNCFGVISSAPVTWRTLARTFCLFVLALLCFGTPTFPLTSTFSRFSLVLSCFALCWFAVHKFGTQRQARQTPLALQMGQRLPPVRLQGELWLEEILPNKGLTLVLLTAPLCSACLSLKESLRQAIVSLSRSLQFIELTLGSEALSNKSVEMPFVYEVGAGELASFQLATPSAVLVDEHGVLREQPASGIDEVMSLIRVALSANRSNEL